MPAPLTLTTKRAATNNGPLARCASQTCMAEMREEQTGIDTAMGKPPEQPRIDCQYRYRLLIATSIGSKMTSSTIAVGQIRQHDEIPKAMSWVPAQVFSTCTYHIHMSAPPDVACIIARPQAAACQISCTSLSLGVPVPSSRYPDAT